VCRRAILELPPDPTSASRARHFLAETAERWEVDELRDDLLLAVSELVTNSVIHARTPILVTAVIAAGHVEVGVRDHDTRPPVVRPERLDLLEDLDSLSEHLPSFSDPDPRHPALWAGEARSVTAGRGLHLLSAVSDSWGVAASDAGPGKEVWFSSRVPESWPHAAECECEHPSDLRSPSGRNLLPLAGPWDRPAATTS
jgi:anti-sigma regulatory factor (Ser/Thr protein kinase)